MMSLHSGIGIDIGRVHSFLGSVPASICDFVCVCVSCVCSVSWSANFSLSKRPSLILLDSLLKEE